MDIDTTGDEKEGTVDPAPAQASTHPSLWLVSGDLRRRLTVRGRQIRTRIGLAAMIDQFVETIALDEVARVEVLAPYSPPTSRLAAILAGCAIGVLIGGENETMTGVVMAITILAFAIVTVVVSRGVPAAHRIARASMRDGRAYCLTYRHEDEDEIRQLFRTSEWSDETVSLMLTALTPEEKHHADGMRFGLVLSASALALITLYATDHPTGGIPDAIGIPAEIIVKAAWCITIAVNVAAWGRVLLHRAGTLRRPANRRGP